MTNPRAVALIGMGANRPWLGRPPEVTLRAAFGALCRLGEGRLSPLYDSPAWPDPSGPAYVNAVMELRTALGPEALLEALLATEAGFGRMRSDDPALRYAPRTLDLDLLAMGDRRSATARLTLPHPRLHERDFVLLPLGDVAPGFIHPESGEGIAAMLSGLPSVTATRRD